MLIGYDAANLGRALGTIPVRRGGHMDDSRFDTLARSISSAQNRRTALKRLIGGVALAAGIGIPSATELLRAGDGEAASACRHGGEICRKDSECCSGGCLPPDRTGRRS